MKMMILTAVVALASLLLVHAAKEDSNIVDLSVDLETSNLDNPGAASIAAVAAATPDIRRALVLEHGKIVANYVKEGVDPDEPFPVYSVTKSWTGLLMGLLIEAGMLSLNETLGGIFVDETVWANVSDAAFRRNVTIRELLTMSSGLIDPGIDWFFEDGWVDGGKFGGADLQSSLSWPYIGPKGVFSYLSVSNILSYVIKERTGVAPREYANKMVFPALGINNSALEWFRNEDGLEYGYWGIHMAAHQMAKFGQLYLQEGLAAPGKQLISSDWVEQSTARQVKSVLVIPVPEPTIIGYGHYGFLFWVANGTWLDNPEAGDFYCAMGAAGQDICVHAELGRVSVQQREGYDPFGNWITTAVAFNKSLSFVVEQPFKGTSSTSSGEWWCPKMPVLVCWLILLVVALVIS